MRKKTKEKKQYIEKVPAILKLREIFSQGYLPSREDQSYKAICPNTNESYAKQINCFAHACLNLTNEQLDNLKFSLHDTNIFDIKEYSYEPEEYIEKKFINTVKRCGLTIEKCKKNFNPTKDNQWKVALYFGFVARILDIDYHFLKQEKDGSWTSKAGWSEIVDHFDELPKEYISPAGARYSLYKTFIISNPQASKDADDIEVFYI